LSTEKLNLQLLLLLLLLLLLCCCYCCCFQANEVSLKKSNFQERLCSSQGARIKFCVLLLLLAATRNLMASEGDPPNTPG